MNKRMKDDYIALLEKKNKRKTIAIFVLAVLLAVCVTLLFTQFEFVVEDGEDIHYEVDQNAGDNSSNNATLDNSTQQESVFPAMICGTIIVCVIFIILGAILYGKSKSAGAHTQKTPCDRTQTKSIVEEKEVDDHE